MTILCTLGAAILVSVLPCDEGRTSHHEARSAAGPTEAPDLVSIGNFRDGPPTDDGTPQTLVDFAFDQPAYLNGGNRSSFALVPLEGGDALDGRGVAPEDDVEGDEVVQVLFEGDLDPAAFARGFVATGTVNSAAGNVGAENPANINQAVPVSGGGTTENPDLVRVTRDGDQVLFEFDEPLTIDDVVQSTSGLRVYFPETGTTGAILQAGSLAVHQSGPTTLRAYYGDDLPPGPDGEPYTLDDAVGAFVVQGSVQAEVGSRGGNDGKNAFDHAAPLGDTGAVVCGPAYETDKPGDYSGRTEGPDLIAVGNFRRGPFTDGFEPTTCVDFAFDQPANLNGGTRSNFNLVPIDASDALPGSTNQTPDYDVPGDRVVTVVFPGELVPESFARGFVDTGVVNSAENSVSADNPLNINQSAHTRPHSETENPDLVSAERQDSTWMVFRFDEPLTIDDVIQSTSGLRVYFPATDQGGTVLEAGAITVEQIDETTLRGSFSDLPLAPDGEPYTLADAVGAFVVQGTVQALKGSRGGNDGKGAFDEVAL
ncbi:hypothetical protein [Rubrivirga sp.]|uniref:hypothetical protein n=1 Tax=Rubrivirga sp. TaxID=1885344 RepID=UPI003C76A577